MKPVLRRNKKAKPADALRAFHADDYLRHNARRLEHLASLGLDLSDKTVLEVGAGIGDMTHFFLDRGCAVTITEGRDVNIDVLRKRYAVSQVAKLNLEAPGDHELGGFDIVFCYGLLYHLSNPEVALQFLAQQTNELLLLETCVSFGAESVLHHVSESAHRPTQAVSGTGCRPTRPWIVTQLKKTFEHVYVPFTQPHHQQFVLDWNSPEEHKPPLARAVFIGSRRELNNDILNKDLPIRQWRH